MNIVWADEAPTAERRERKYAKEHFPGRGTPRVVERKPDRSVNIFRVTRVEREVKSKGGWTPVPVGDRGRDRELGSS